MEPCLDSGGASSTAKLSLVWKPEEHGWCWRTRAANTAKAEKEFGTILTQFGPISNISSPSNDLCDASSVLQPSIVSWRLLLPKQSPAAPWTWGWLRAQEVPHAQMGSQGTPVLLEVDTEPHSFSFARLSAPNSSTSTVFSLFFDSLIKEHFQL